MQNIILLHGALGAETDLEPLRESLQGSHTSVHAFSFSGHGGRAFENDFTIAQFTAELEGSIIENNLQNALVFGYSMGGYVALNLAHQKPGLVSKIVTLGTKFNWTAEAVKKETALMDPDLILEKMPLFAGSLKQKHGDSWRELLQKTGGMMQEISDRGYLTESVLKSIDTPVLLGIGDKDKMVTQDETTAVYKTLPNAGMYMLPHTRHPLETADMRLLSRMIKTFAIKS